MAESNNTENVDKNSKEKFENPKSFLQSTIFTEYQNEELIYPNKRLEMLKRKLEIVRSRVDDKLKKNISPLRRPMNNTPLHEVFKNLINKDSFSSLASSLVNENDVYSKYSSDKYYHNLILRTLRLLIKIQRTLLKNTIKL